MTRKSKPTALILSYYYPPHNTSGVFRTLYFFNHIARCKQWRINILTLDPKSYIKGQNKDEKLNKQIDPLIQVFRVRSIHPREAVIRLKNSLKGKKYGSGGAVKVNSHVKIIRNEKRNLWCRCKDIITEDVLAFPDDKIGWLPFSFSEACKIIAENKVDLIYSTGSPWTSHLLAYLLKKKTGLPLVLDYRDPWLGNPYELTRHSTLYKKASLFLEKKIIGKADKVICNTERLRSFYSETFGVEDKFFVISNGFEPEGDNHIIASNANVFRIVHAGALYGGRNPVNFLQAVANIVERKPQKKIEVYLVGAGDEVRESIIKIFGVEWLDKFFFVTPRLGHSKCLDYLRCADLLLLFQQGTKLQVPRKLYEYIGMKKSILGVCEEGETEDIIIQNKLGISIRDDINEIENALTELMNIDRTLNASVNKFEHFNNIILAKKVAELFDAILNEGNG